MNVTYDVVVPTIGRPSLGILLASLAEAEGPLPGRVVVVDDRGDASVPLDLSATARSVLIDRIVVVRGDAAGPAAARNRGWRYAIAPWVAFLDDDVVVDGTWRRDLVADLDACASTCAGTQGEVRVPLDASRRPTDWERNVRGLEGAAYITADFAYRRDVLIATGGFDERFPRAYREDAELALRVLDGGWTLAKGVRSVRHPVRPADVWISVRLQAGNADDALIEALHPGWRERAHSERGRFRSHVVTVAAACAAVVTAAIFLTRVLAFAWQRIAPGPRDRREIGTMLTTSAVLPFAAVYHRCAGAMRLSRTLRRPAQRASAVFFDRDGTLLEDDPQLRDPADVRFIEGAVGAVERLHAADIVCGIVTNQPRVGEGTLDARELDAIHARIDAIAGPFAVVEACVHARGAGCDCRKPAPGLVLSAAKKIGIPPAACVVVGDIASDLAAARAAGARAILVPTLQTRRSEIDEAAVVARTLHEAVDLILSGTV